MTLPHLKAEFSQVAVMSGATNAAATAGACHNFSLEWIAAMYKKADPDGAGGRMAALRKQKGGAAMVTQKIFVNEWTRQSAEIADKGVAAWRGLQFAGDRVPYSNYSKESFLQGINTTDIAGLIYSFWFSGSVPGAAGGAHTIAFFRQMATRRGSTAKADNRIFAFDPNFGEFLMVEGQLPAWIDDLFGNYGPCNAQWMRGFKTLA